MKKNKKQQLENAKNAVKGGNVLPTTLKLAATLPSGDNRGEKRKRKELKTEVRSSVI